jgi:hypothetical protein
VTTRRRLSLCASLAVWALLGVLVWLDTTYPLTPTPIRAAWVGALFAGIGAAFSWLGRHAASTAAIIARVTVMISSAVGRLAKSVARELLKVLGHTRQLYTSVIRPFVEWSWRELRRLRTWLRGTFGPVIRAVDRMRQQLRRLYDKWVRPVVDTISLVRRILQVLDRLGVSVAGELDRRLAAVESRIFAYVVLAFQKINEVANILNRVVTLDGLFQRLTLVRSLISYSRDLVAIWWRATHRPLEGERLEEYRRRQEPRPLAAVRADLVAYITTGGGPDQARIDEHVADMRLRLRRLRAG